MGESGRQASFLRRDGKVDGDVVSQNLENEIGALLTIDTAELRKRAMDMIRSGEAKNAQEAVSKINEEDAGYRTNDQWG